MNSKVFTTRFWFVLSIILAGAAMRLIPHWPNFTPIAAMALLGGAYMGRKYLAFIIPLAALLLSDLLLGFHSTMPAVYISFVITVVLGIYMLRNPKILNIIGASLISTVLFFIITNFAAWLGSPLYPQNITGLAESYIAGLAFFNNGSLGISFFMNSLLGDLFYNGLFFGVFYLARLRFPVLARS
ncbi:MAG TPA: hypothetical protein PKW80_00450 [Bacteroidales bacterium]|nr:hypothetical protein [Bacteroidales bacterium]